MLIISAVALAMAYAYMEIQVIRANKKKSSLARVNNKATGVGKAKIGGDWSLLDTNNKPFNSKDLEGKYYLIYFGFTHCPDICPNSLTKLSRAVAKVKKSKEANFFDLKTVFVSVDPDRDTGEKIKKFVMNFDPEIIGVTGTNNQDPALRDCMKTFKIYASKL
jgi:protein SCO1/2